MSLGKAYIYFVIFLLSPFVVTTQCILTSPVPIPPESTQQLSFGVSGLTQNQLSVNQSVCAVFIELEHGRLENCRFILTAPSGESITLIGPGTNGGAFTSSVNWNISFLPCSGPVSPDAGYSVTWDNNQVWSFFGRYTGSYYPQQGCIDDFTGSANGEWTLELINLGTNEGQLIYFELFFCSPDGLVCELCNPNPGSFDQDFIQICEGDPSFNVLAPSFSQAPVVAANEAYSYAVENPIGELQFTISFDVLDTLSIGRYTICGLVSDTSLLDDLQNATALNELTILAEAEGCAALMTDCMQIEVLPIQNLEVVEATVCRGDTIDVMGLPFHTATDTLVYAMTPGQAACESATRIIISELSYEIALQTEPDPVFCGQDIILRTDPVDFSLDPTYLWEKDDSPFSGAGPLISITEPGTYVLGVAVDACLVTDTIVLLPNTDFSQQINIETRNCGTEAFELAVLQLTGPQSITRTVLSLEGPSGSVPLPVELSSFSLVEQGEYILTTALGDCMTMDTFTLADNLLPTTLTAEADTELGCDGVAVPIVITTDMVNPTFTYEGPEAIPDGVIDPMVTTPGTYLITATDANLCTDTVSVTVTGIADLPLVVVEDLEVACDFMGPIVFNAQMSGVIDSLIWTGPDGEVYIPQSAGDIQEGIYRLTAYGPNGCNNTDSLRLTLVNTPGDLGVQTLELTCIEDTLTLVNETGLIPISIEWTNQAGTVLSEMMTVTIDAPGTYQLSVTAANGCTALQSYVVTDNSLSTNLDNITVFQQDTTCLEIQTLSVEGNLSDLQSLMIAGVDYDPTSTILLPTGSYTVMLIDVDGCERVLNVELVAEQTPTLDLGPDVTIGIDEDYNIPGSSSANDTGDWVYAWSDNSVLSCNDCLTPVFSGTSSQSLTLTITDAFGCEWSDTVLISVETPTDFDELGIYIPTAFNLSASPPNDQFTIGIDVDQYSSYEFRLYDRWGNLVVDDAGPVSSPNLMLWNGKVTNRPLEQGVYVFMAKFLHMTQEERSFSGQITLFR